MCGQFINLIRMWDFLVYFLFNFSTDKKNQKNLGGGLRMILKTFCLNDDISLRNC